MRFPLSLRLLILPPLLVLVTAAGFYEVLKLSRGNTSLPSSGKVDLLRGYDWSHFDGASQTDGGIIFTPPERKIVKQDGTGGQPNPAVNIAGPHITYKSIGNIEASFKNFQEGDSFRLYAGVPIIYDEWRYEPPSLDIGLQDGQLKVSYYNGNASAPSHVSWFKLPGVTLERISIEQDDESFRISANDAVIGTIEAPGMFETHASWFGGSAQQYSWTLTSLLVSGENVQVANGLDWSRPIVETKTLAESARRRLQIGAAVSLTPLLTDARYRELALTQFNIWTTENALKPEFIHPALGIYDFREADLLVDIARRNNIAIHAHTLIFGEANPHWMQVAPPNERRQIMLDHIATVAGHFKGRVQEWDVVNEPLSNDDADYATDGLRRHIWYQAMGSDYIAIALKAAHNADPGAKLYINDFGLEADGERWNALLRLVRALQAQRVPLDGIGFEAHVHEDADHIDPAVLQRHIKELAELGLSARISEIDVHGEDEAQQADEYKGALSACLQEPTCRAFSTWGITDRYGSTADANVYPLSYGDELLWSSEYIAKPAYQALLDALK